MGISTISSNLHPANQSTITKTAEKQTDSTEEKATPARDVLVMYDGSDREEELLKSMREIADSLKGARQIEGAMDKEHFQLQDQGIVTSPKAVLGSDGRLFYVSKWHDTASDETFDSDYMSVLENVARGETEEEHLLNYARLYNFNADIRSFFSTVDTSLDDRNYIKECLEAVIEEIRQNIAEGKENPTEDLQTKITLNGVDWSISDLAGAVQALKTACFSSSTAVTDNFTIENTIVMDYKDYARLGMAVGYVSKYASENLDKEHADALNSIMQARVDAAIARNSAYMDEHQAETDAEWARIQSAPDYHLYKANWDDRRQYYSYGRNNCLATNQQLIDKMMEIFSSVGSGKSINSALSEYLQLMTPVYNSLNISPQLSFNHHSTDLLGYYNALYGR